MRHSRLHEILKRALSTAGALILTACLAVCVLIGLSCKKTPTTPEPPPPPVVKEKILTTVNADYVFGGQPVSGSVEYKALEAPGGASNGRIGEQVSLGEIPAGTTKSFDITITPDNLNQGLKRIYKEVALSGTQTINSKLLDLEGFNHSGYLKYFLMDSTNRVWNQESITVIFSPNPITGVKLPKDYISETKKAIEEIKDYSKGFIKSISYDENGNKPFDATIPPDGEIWLYCYDRSVPVGNVSYGEEDNVVKSAKIWYDLSGSSDTQVKNETQDAFIHGNQNEFPEEYLPLWFEFSLRHRPKGEENNYRIYLDREEQKGLDIETKLAQGMSVYNNQEEALPLQNPGWYDLPGRDLIIFEGKTEARDREKNQGRKKRP